MRMVVVLPLPLGPRKPQIWPRATWMRDMVDHRARAEALDQAAHVDDRAHRQAHVDGLARVEA